MENVQRLFPVHPYFILAVDRYFYEIIVYISLYDRFFLYKV